MKKVLLNAMLLGAIAFTACNKDDEGTTPPNPGNDNCETCAEFDTTMYEDGNEQMVKLVTITDNGDGVGTVTFENTTNYILNGKVFVNDGQTLTIEEGTVIKGAAGTGPNAASLIVSVGAKIMAEGSPEMPIIFTSTADETYRDMAGNLNYSTELPMTAKGLWGGVGILGNGQINEEAPQQFEGTTDSRGEYGSANADNNGESSGVFKYVSIKHGGAEIAAGDELNGLGLAGVGSGTEIHHVEVLANQDDGIEIWGSETEISYCAISNVGDDGLDWDQGWSGSASNIFVMYESAGGHGGEWDGDDGSRETPYASPMISNVTFIGAGSKYGALFRENAGGTLSRSIIANFEYGVVIDNDGTPNSKARYDDNTLTLEDLVFANITESLVIESSEEGGAVEASDEITTTFTESALGLDVTSSTIIVVPTTVPDNGNGYIGAFDGTDMWLSGWTALDMYGRL